MIIIKSVNVLDNTIEYQLFPIEIKYMEDGVEYVRSTSAKEIIELFKVVQRKTEENKE